MSKFMLGLFNVYLLDSEHILPLYISHRISTKTKNLYWRLLYLVTLFINRQAVLFLWVIQKMELSVIKNGTKINISYLEGKTKLLLIPDKKTMLIID